MIPFLRNVNEGKESACIFFNPVVLLHIPNSTKKKISTKSESNNNLQVNFFYDEFYAGSLFLCSLVVDLFYTRLE